MIRYHFDLYPRDDPRDGTRLVRFTKLQAATYKDVLGVGSGAFSIRASETEAEFIDPAGEQYVRVVEENTVGPTETVVGGFFISEMRYSAADSTGSQRLVCGGPGVLAYLARSVMATHTYHPGGFDPNDDEWRLFAQGPPADTLGSAFWRVIYEATHFRVGTTPYLHRHADGTFATDIHDDDRLATAIPDADVSSFDNLLDSHGNAWTIPEGQIRVRIGENVLGVVKLFLDSGLFIRMDPDTWELHACEGHRVDRTAASWAENVIRFQTPTDATIVTGNLKSDAERLIKSHIRRSTLWVGADNTYIKRTNASADIPWEGFEYYGAVEDASMESFADEQITAREEAFDNLTIRFKLGDSEPDGYYRPWIDVDIDDLVVVHSGSDTWDFNEQDFPVAALRIELRQGGDWDAYADLGGSFNSIDSRRFEVPPPAVITGLKLCPPFSEGIGSAVLDSWGSDAGGPSGINEQVHHIVDVTDTGQGIITMIWGSESSGDVSSVIWDNSGPNQNFTKLLDETYVSTDHGTVRGEIWHLANPTPTTGGIVKIQFVADDRAQTFSAVVDTDAVPTVDQVFSETEPASNATGAGSADLVVDHFVSVSTTQTLDDFPDPGAGQTLLDQAQRFGSGPDHQGGASWEVGASVMEWDVSGVTGLDFTLHQMAVFSGSAAENPLNGVSPFAARCDHEHDASDHSHDHGDLTGLADDDHTAYASDADLTAHTGDVTDAHDASAISVLDTGGNFTATDVEGVLAELDASISAGGIPATIFDAAGDIIVASAADTAARLAAGSEDDVLTIVSGVPTWAAPTGGGSVPGFGDGSQATLRGAATATGASPLSLTKPAGTADGDLIVLAIQTVNSIPDVGGPGGGGAAWNNLLRFDTSSNEWQAVYWKIAASEPAAWTFAHSAGTEVAAAVSVFDPDASVALDDLWHHAWAVDSLETPPVVGHPEGLQVLIWMQLTTDITLTPGDAFTQSAYALVASGNRPQVLMAYRDTTWEGSGIPLAANGSANAFSLGFAAVFWESP